MELAQDKDIKDPMKRQFIDTNMTNGQVASFIADFVPFLGGIKAADEARTGKQHFTGAKLDATDRAIAGAGVLGAGFTKIVGTGAKMVLKGKPLSEQTHLKWNKKIGEVKQHTPKKAKGTGNVKSTFSGRTMEHIFHGNVNGRGLPSGYHHGNIMSKAKLSNISSPDKFGVYKATIEINGKTKFSTLFPDSWNLVKVLDEIKYTRSTVL
ncbi:pre-toxin TG domain-containing protein [Priestia filamentosa]|uniref:pre-toxin TG domain-containing protein n=1 Tax=Priestia filamentosa TaxID=1402861 RepID=UPI00030F4A44|nr:pre-toxin TG domain-containing protein [Priestia filamentosa]